MLLLLLLLLLPRQQTITASNWRLETQHQTIRRANMGADIDGGESGTGENANAN
jgi:hypothetical protein